MKKATNLVELFQNLVPGKFLSPDTDSQFYVSVYEETLNNLRFNIQTYQNKEHTFYVTGQSGTGKTTALNFLPTPELAATYYVIPFYARELLDLNDIDIIDLMLMTCYQLLEEEKKIPGSNKLKKLFGKTLDKIRDKQAGILEESVEQEKTRNKNAGVEGKVEVGTDVNPFIKFLSLFKANASFFASYKMDQNYRKITRTAFQLNKRELLDLTNEMIGIFLEYEGVHGKEILLVFNELDHVKDLKQIKDLFIENRYYLEGIQCKKVLSIPVILSTEGEFTLQGEIFSFGLKVKKNTLPEAEGRDQPEVAINRAKLRQIALQRIESGLSLITDEAIERAIDASGGNVRQFVSILHFAARRGAMAKAEKISLADVEDGINKIRSQMELSIISGGRISVLEHVRTQKKPNSPDSEEFLNALLSNQVIIYHNEPAWFEVNPLIERTVQIYAKNQSS